MILSLFLYGLTCGTGVTDWKERSFTMQQDIINDTKEEAERPVISFEKNIGHTTYRVTAYCSKTARETIEEKLLRVITEEALRTN
jgi:hypothetical protein